MSEVWKAYVLNGLVWVLVAALAGIAFLWPEQTVAGYACFAVFIAVEYGAGLLVKEAFEQKRQLVRASFIAAALACTGAIGNREWHALEQLGVMLEGTATDSKRQGNGSRGAYDNAKRDLDRLAAREPLTVAEAMQALDKKLDELDAPLMRSSKRCSDITKDSQRAECAKASTQRDAVTLAKEFAAATEREASLRSSLGSTPQARVDSAGLMPVFICFLLLVHGGALTGSLRLAAAKRREAAKPLKRPAPPPPPPVPIHRTFSLIPSAQARIVRS